MYFVQELLLKCVIVTSCCTVRVNSDSRRSRQEARFAREDLVLLAVNHSKTVTASKCIRYLKHNSRVDEHSHTVKPV